MTATREADAGARWGDEAEPAVRLAFGDWRLARVGAGFSDISYKDTPVLRAVRVVVRDEDWRTVEPALESVDVVQSESELRVVVVARSHEPPVDFAWTATLVVDDAGLRFDFSGTADSPFLRNRLGLIVLHPPRLAGSDLTVTAPDGRTTRTSFPTAIAPHQPAKNIATLAWSSDGIDSVLALHGDVFEMEDQRNWTDASFKTYSTPLVEPFPVRLEPGVRVAHSLSLRCSGAPEPRPASPTPTLSASLQRFPGIGLSAATGPDTRDAGHPPVVQSLLVELDIRDGNWRAALRRAQADASGSRLDVRIIARDTPDVDTALDAISGLEPVRVGVVDAHTHVSEPALWEALVSGAAERGIEAELLTGTRAHFTELNRTHDRLPPGPVAFSITPQMHDCELQQILESIDMQRLVARQAVDFAAGKPVHVGPVTLRARFNAVATSPYRPDDAEDVSAGYGPERVPGSTDTRQSRDGLAVWTVASALALAIGGVSSITFGEQWGPRGCGDDSGSFPVAGAVEMLADLAGEQMREVIGLPAGCRGAAFPARREAVFTNVSCDEMTARIPEIGAVIVPSCEVRRIVY